MPKAVQVYRDIYQRQYGDTGIYTKGSTGIPGYIPKAVQGYRDIYQRQYRYTGIYTHGITGIPA
jgi:hypothetical protein